jgi:hypothetical protein
MCREREERSNESGDATISEREIIAALVRKDFLPRDGIFNLGVASKTSKISDKYMALVPHMERASAAPSDSHYAKTLALRNAFAEDPNQDLVIDMYWSQDAKTPLSRAYWKEILLDRYIDFEKLFAALRPDSAQYEDEAALGEFVLVKKELASARRAIHNQNEWTKIFDAWASAVSMAFKHRAEEIENYRTFVMVSFEDHPLNLYIAISFDTLTGQKYAFSHRRPNKSSSFDVLSHRKR